MSGAVMFLAPLAVVVLLSAPLIASFKKVSNGKKARGAVLLNIGMFFGIIGLCFILSSGDFIAYAAGEAAAETAAAGASVGTGLGYLAAALVTGLSAIGAGIAVAAGAPAAIGATSEDPKAFGKSLIFVVLGEGIALYGLLISFLIINSL
ncbi:MAG TPA: ATPase [Ruminococcaceae bacterium]|nr:ATPase [Oscillospiraceae bacterium]